MAGLATEGIDGLKGALDGMAAAAENNRSWWVGTIVFYAPFLEFGTRKFPAHPFFQPAIFQVASRLENVTARSSGERFSGRAMFNLLVDGDKSVAREVAFELERTVKKLIKQKGLIDTSNLINSITAAPGPGAVERKSRENLLDPDSAIR